MLSGNPCKQTCFYNGACTDQLKTPDLTVADGTVCSTNPTQTCKAGVCGSGTTNPVQGTWVKVNPSACSCAGQQTVTVQCQDSAGNVLPTSSCSGTAPSTTQSCPRVLAIESGSSSRSAARGIELERFASFEQLKNRKQ